VITGRHENERYQEAGAETQDYQANLGIIRPDSVLFLDQHGSPFIIEVQTDLRHNRLLEALLPLDDFGHEMVSSHASTTSRNYGLVRLVLFMDVSLSELFT
jgi:hypothetical protein